MKPSLKEKYQKGTLPPPFWGGSFLGIYDPLVFAKPFMFVQKHVVSNRFPSLGLPSPVQANPMMFLFRLVLGQIWKTIFLLASQIS